MNIHPVLRLILVYITCFTAYSNIQAQEILKSLDVNPTLVQYRMQHPIAKLKSLSADIITKLPFQDDFSSTSIIPDQNLWSDEYVYVNSTLADSLPSLGIATFDALGSDGKVYPDIDISSFNADVLTSKPIYLDYQDSTHIWLSFYYLPGGLGDAPGINDSLILEYYSPVSGLWSPRWVARNGDDNLILNFYSPETTKWDTLNLVRNTKDFRLAMVPVLQDQYRKSGFRFRFRNTASISGSVDGKLGMVDLWHIDYVLLDTGRTVLDTVYHDLAFYKPMSSLLKTYTSMPFNQLIASKSQLKSTIEYSVRNNNNVYVTPTKTIRFTELNYSDFSPTTNYTEMGINKDPVEKFSFYTVNPDLTNPFTTNLTQNVVYEIKSYFNQLDLWPSNDTVKYLHKFLNYFAYDDSSSESGYGIENINGIAAYGFNIYETDTLSGISIYFNPTLNEVNKEYYFKLAVWADNNGKPGTLLYKDNSDASRQPTSLGKFVTYALDSSIVLSNRFYVGWFQVDDNFLNIGYDLNTNGRSNLFYNTYGEWIQSGSQNSEVVAGSLMIRPVFRSDKTTGITIIKSDTESLKIYPNPATDFISISGVSQTNSVKNILFYNTVGQLLKRVDSPDSDTIDISLIPQGICIVKVIFSNGTSTLLKLLKK